MAKVISKNNSSVLKFFSGLIANFRSTYKLGTARNYDKAFRSLSVFLRGKDIPFSRFNECLVLRYNDYLLGRHVSKNSISFYNRILRAVYNKAVKQSLARQTFPFNEVYTGISQTRKRAVKEDVIRNLKELDLTLTPSLSLARDLFVFSFYTRGMAFVDMAFLRRSDVAGGYIRYQRHKTGKGLMIRIEPCMETIINRYTGSGTPYYIFPLLSSLDKNTAFREYQTALGYHNKKLKALARMLKLDTPLTSYTARHTWATLALRHHIPIGIISAGLGHTSERTTRIYLDSIDNRDIDEANRILLQGLWKRKGMETNP